MAKFSLILGGRVKNIVSGGAPTAPHVLDFLKESLLLHHPPPSLLSLLSLTHLSFPRCFGHSSESYGATEVGGISHNGEFTERLSSISSSLPSLLFSFYSPSLLILLTFLFLFLSADLKLVDWEEYKSTDQPFPRGELWLKSWEMVPLLFLPLSRLFPSHSFPFLLFH